jgi:hypothetical protein
VSGNQPESSNKYNKSPLTGANIEQRQMYVTAGLCCSLKKQQGSVRKLLDFAYGWNFESRKGKK